MVHARKTGPLASLYHWQVSSYLTSLVVAAGWIGLKQLQWILAPWPTQSKNLFSSRRGRRPSSCSGGGQLETPQLHVLALEERGLLFLAQSL